jgi:transcriptional regulator with XRE-family HTH domain
MTAKPSPARRSFGAELRQLRKAAGLSQAEAASRTGWSQSKVSKSERGATLLPPEDVRVWARLTGADQETSDRLVGLAVDLNTEDADWSADEGEFAERNIYIGDVERDSAGLRNFQPSAVSGLLQTADYARRVMTLLDRRGEHDVPAAVAARAERQTILYDTSKRFEFVLTEGALRWRPGPPELMLAQLDRLLSIATLPNVSIGVLPFDREATALYVNGFTIFDHPDDPFVLVESYGGERRFHDEKTLGKYRSVFAELHESALTGSEATDVIRRLMDDLRRD